MLSAFSLLCYSLYNRTTEQIHFLLRLLSPSASSSSSFFFCKLGNGFFLLITMFYSHQLLARKAALGQIWMAATVHAKIHRRKLDKLNIIKICEEILNPSVPMALRLSGILMGGVVIVYERKVKLLYDDVSRLLIEINAAWKVKVAPSDSTRPRKSKSQAKRGSVTFPPRSDEDRGTSEQSVRRSEGNAMDFERDSYAAMKLDAVADPFVSEDPVGDQNHDYHQADAINITLCNHESLQHDTTPFDRFERFDIEGDGTEHIFSSADQLEILSPPHHEELKKSRKLHEKIPHEQIGQKFHERNESHAGQMGPVFAQRRARRRKAVVMDNDQNIIPGQIYQTWLQNPSGLCSRKASKRKRTMDPFSTVKIDILMKLPALTLVQNLFDVANRRVHYPAPLLELWVRNTQDSDDSTSEGKHSDTPSSSSPPERATFPKPTGDGVSIERQRANAHYNELPPDIIMEELRSSLKHVASGTKEVNRIGASTFDPIMTPANSGDEIRSIPSSGSGHGFFSHNSDANSGRSGKKRAFSASVHSGNGLEPVAEELSWQHPDPSFKLATATLPEHDPDLFVETGLTLTQKKQATNQPLDHITDSIRMHLKAHFDTPGSANEESLDQLAFGMNRKQAASLFYHSCVLATRGDIKLEQKVPYGEILISRGAMM